MSASNCVAIKWCPPPVSHAVRPCYLSNTLRRNLPPPHPPLSHPPVGVFLVDCDCWPLLTRCPHAVATRTIISNIPTSLLSCTSSHTVAPTDTSLRAPRMAPRTRRPNDIVNKTHPRRPHIILRTLRVPPHGRSTSINTVTLSFTTAAKRE